MKIALLIPIYEPSELVLPFLQTFKEGDFADFLVVDDGSGEKYRSIFQEIAKTTVFRVLSYENNQGKGFAMKFGLRFLMKEGNDLDGIVTGDGDGQHCYEDILRMRDALMESPEALTVGVRDISVMPPKSRSGNVWTARFFHFFSGKRIDETQTGLRGIPSCLFPLFLGVKGTRYEFEMNFLLAAAKIRPLEQLPIQTIYIDNNAGSHFRPFMDSARFVIEPLWRTAAAIVAYGLGFVLMALLLRFAFPAGMGFFFLAFALGLLLTTGTHVLLRHFVIYRGLAPFPHGIKRILLYLSGAAISFGLTWTFFSVAGWNLIWAKLLADLIVSVFVFVVHRTLVYPSK